MIFLLAVIGVIAAAIFGGLYLSSLLFLKTDPEMLTAFATGIVASLLFSNTILLGSISELLKAQRRLSVQQARYVLQMLDVLHRMQFPAGPPQNAPVNDSQYE